MGEPAESSSLLKEVEAAMKEVVLEEIEDDMEVECSLSFLSCSGESIPGTPESPEAPFKLRRSMKSLSLESRVTRDFGNISPISELGDVSNTDEESESGKGEEEKLNKPAKQAKQGVLKTPEPVVRRSRSSTEGIPDGRSSPILAFSPTLIKIISSNDNSLLDEETSETAQTSDGATAELAKRPRTASPPNKSRKKRSSSLGK